MNDLSRNETIKFIAKQEFPEYSLLVRIRSNRRDESQLDEAEQELIRNRGLIKNIAGYIRNVRGLSPTKIAELKSEANKKLSEGIEAEKLKRLESRKQRDKELFFNYPSQQADFDSWAKMDYWTIDEAVALTFSRNPKVVNRDNVFQYALVSPFAKEYVERHTLVQRACTSGALIRPIVPIRFIRWADIKGIKYPDELLTRVQSYDCTGDINNSVAMPEITKNIEHVDSACDSQTFQEAAAGISPFDPLPISGIAKIFAINPVPQNNLDEWIKYASQAKRKGLDDARVTKGIGRSKSTFDPMNVGVWIVQKGLLSQDVIDRSLAKNLPERSKHLKDYFAKQ